jgi:putative tricarboxylic transport membrane protein
LLFATAPQLVWGLIASLLVANVMLLVLNLPLIRFWVLLLKIPQPWLYGGILVFATLGTLGVNPSVVELMMLVLFGTLGYLMRLYGYPIAPVVVGLILGPMAEQQLRRALAIAQGDPMTLVQSPIAAGLLFLAAVALVVPMILRARGRGDKLAQIGTAED